MINFLKFVVVLLLFSFWGCKGGNDAYYANSPEFMVSGIHPETDSVILRIALLGDAEPKPLAEFPNMAAAVEHINTLSQTLPIDFVIGIGDIAHNGTEIQYEAATPVLQKLKAPFYPIMGNEEHSNSVELYLQYAKKWNDKVVTPSYVINHSKVAFVFASPDYGREFNDNGACGYWSRFSDWLQNRLFWSCMGRKRAFSPKIQRRGLGTNSLLKRLLRNPIYLR
jgi:3',5'-cyclic-AMP phosphodiesterase